MPIDDARTRNISNHESTGGNTNERKRNHFDDNDDSGVAIKVTSSTSSLEDIDDKVRSRDSSIFERRQRRAKSVDESDDRSATGVALNRTADEDTVSVASSILNRKQKEKSLVRRITNEMQIARLNKINDEQKMSSTVVVAEGDTTDPSSKRKYRMYAFRFVERGLRQSLWYLGRAVASHKVLFCFPLP
ncbi:hypothetical protein AB6A40_005222 [Gnathostoma spinigerum]|uniref:Uncharacterized protein n=1 Tax=Gnathostoma spinigerum TaxID=75299 RepID=A0ABD6EEY9_9BILA